MDQIKIGAFLKTLRREKNMTQEQLAEQLGVSSRTVSRWETGSNIPDISLLAELAEFYDVSIPELIDGERKSEIMNEEIKEVADKMADYAGAEKTTIIKNIRNDGEWEKKITDIENEVNSSYARKPTNNKKSKIFI